MTVFFIKLGLCDNYTNSTFEMDKSQCRQKFIYFDFKYLSRTMSQGAPKRGIELHVNKLQIPEQMWLFENVVICLSVQCMSMCFYPPSFLHSARSKKKKLTEISVKIIIC